MKPSRIQGSFALPMTIIVILAGAITISVLFFSFWQKLNNKVEVILKDQFNQQQLMLARKIADNVESYFDFLENALMGYAGLFQATPPKEREMDDVLAERFARHKRFGILAIVRYTPAGTGVQAFSTAAKPPLAASLTLPVEYLKWARDPAHRGRLFLSKTIVYSTPPWQGRRVMRFLTPLYWGPDQVFSGVLEFLIDPFFICEKVTADVRSGQTGYAWIIDQDEIFMAHYEKDFVGHNAIQVRVARNPKIVFRGLQELNEALLAGKEGMTEYDSGWHREKLGPTPKLAAYTPISFQKGLITGVTDLEDPSHNHWGVAVVAPVEEVYGQVKEVLHQELFLAGLFFVVVLLASIALIVAALVFNKTLARQVERRLIEDTGAKEKLRIIQGEVRRLESFLGELRDFLRPAHPSKQEVDLNEIILEVKALMSPAAEEKGLSLEDHLDPYLPRLHADPNQLNQVLVNLVKNAMEATENGNHIIISTGSKDKQVWFSIQDDGKGMSPEVQEKIFHPFFTTKEKGTGLGLAVIHKIITDHNGTVDLETTPGEGSTFTIRLPLNS